MTRRRWIADEVSGDRAALLGANAAHLARVLRARVGQEFDIAADGRVRRGRVIAVRPDRVEFELGEEIMVSAAPDVTVLLAIFKFDRMEWAIEKLTELGITRIVPLVAKRTDAHLAGAAEKRVERWRRVGRESAQQSRRVAPPQIDSPAKLKEALDVDAGRRIVLAESEEGTSLKEALAGAAGAPVALAVGPEGGWTAQELQLFTTSGWTPASLGPTILRAETAAVAAVAIVVSEVSQAASTANH
jgi:16S rRNA (uracil1498-N3)-methyltransferase